MRSFIALACLTSAGSMCVAGCGTTLSLLTPRSEVTYQEVSTTTTVAVTTRPAGLTLLVDGAEAGVSPRAVPITHKQVRRTSHRSAMPALLGTAVDILAFSIVTLAAADEEPDAGLLAATIGVSTIALDIHMLRSRSSIDEGVESLPVSTRIGVQTPFGASERTIRVPDIDHLELDFQPQGWMMLPQQFVPQPVAPQQLAPQVQQQELQAPGQGAMATPSQPAGYGSSVMLPSLPSSATGS